MSKKSEALRLADALGAAIKQVDADDDVIHVARWFVEDADAELRRLTAVEAERDALKQTLHDELAGNLRLRDLGGARPDEPMLTFLERIIAERDALLEALRAMLEQFNYHTITGIVHDESAAIDKARAAIDAVAAGDTRAEPVEPAQQTAVPLDTRRLDWLEAHAIEEFVRPETIHSEFADLRMRWALPKLQSYNSIGSRFTVREAIDIELEKESGDAAE